MSKKLENNGLWESSRMMLPQHREALLSRHHDRRGVRSDPPKREDMELIRDYILLPIMHTLVIKKVSEAKVSTETLKSLYAMAAQVLAANIYKDLSKVKQEMMEKEIRVVNEEKHEDVLKLHYAYHDFEDRLIITKEYMKAEISKRLARYTDSLIIKLSRL
ncbi:hypothetical protein [Paenibacillus guangzhouensis]|uniref:hypothetical protein n=1 Tax=Paenibacillus guangzhouensis TaxID=1473112 RepID=UPI0012669720|nr:hypothetical protein [Paenibacillus guangzhouensis]